MRQRPDAHAEWETLPMCGKVMAGIVAVMILGAAATTPAIGASSKQRGARPAPSYNIPPPAYGVRADGRAHSSNPAHDVYVNGKYAGSDPDPKIRGSIARDPWPGSHR
jgi:hypothetical protein